RDVQAILDGLPRQSPELQTRFEQTRARLEGNPPLSVVEQLDATWEATRAKLRGWNEVLTQWTGRVEQERTRLAGLRDSWLRSREGWAAAGAPKVVLEQIDGTVAALNATRTRVETRLSTLLLAQYRLAQLQRRADEALSRTAHARADRLHRLGRREGPALWERGVWAGAVEQSAAAARDVQGAQAALVSELTREHAPRAPLHVLLFGILLALLWRGRRAARRWNADGAAGTPPRRAPVAARRATEGSLSWRGPGPSTLRSSAGFQPAPSCCGGVRRGPSRPPPTDQYR
ncbi:MAG TPA: hypothetical protein VF653_09375, partial [Methylomirabilota bacterium]